MNYGKKMKLYCDKITLYQGKITDYLFQMMKFYEDYHKEPVYKQIGNVDGSRKVGRPKKEIKSKDLVNDVVRAVKNKILKTKKKSSKL